MTEYNENMNACFRKLSISALKRTPAFSAGLFVLFVLLAGMSSMTSSFRETVPGSVEAFVEESNMPDIRIVTEGADREQSSEVRKIPGVRAVSAGAVFPARLILPSGKDLSPAVFSVEEDDLRRYHLTETALSRKDCVNVWLSAYFAEKNGVVPRSFLTLKTPHGEESVYVAGLVSIPETMYCLRNETSFNDAAGYGYVFMMRRDVDRLFGIYEKANTWSVWLEDGLKAPERETACTAVESVFGDKVISAGLYETSREKAEMDDMMETIRRICDTFPILLFGTGLFFMILFVSQVIRSRRKDIGILMALGHSRGAVLRIYAGYILILMVPAVFAGTLIGFLITVLCSRLTTEVYYLPRIIYRMDVGRYILMVLAEILCGFFSCLISTLSEVDADPAAAMYSAEGTRKEPSAFLKKLSLEPLAKYSIASVFRNGRRTVLSILAIGACVVLSAGSLEYYIAYADAIPRTFGKRYTYDALVGVTNGREGVEEIRKTEGIAVTEPVLSFRGEMKNGTVSLEGKVSAILEDATLIVPYTSDYRRVPVSDGVVLDEQTARELGVSEGDTVTVDGSLLTVTGICRNLADRTSYISFDTAFKMGHEGPDTAAVKFAEGVKRESVLKSMAGTSGYGYVTFYEDQLVCQREYTGMVRVSIASLQIMALLMGMIIVINMISISISERKHDFAVLLALGVSDGKLFGMILLESFVDLALASVPAFPAARAGADIMNRLMSSPAQAVEMYGFTEAFGIAVLLALLYMAVGIVSGSRKLRSIDPAGALEEE